jgi:hypothetical protein
LIRLSGIACMVIFSVWGGIFSSRENLVMILEGDMSCRHEGGFSRNDIARKSIAYHLVLATYGEIRSNVSCL